MIAVDERYWDSNAFLGWLNQEPNCFGQLDAIIQRARAGKCRIVTSAMTLAEVFWLRGGLPKAEQTAAIQALFAHSWIIVAQLDRLTAELARELMATFSQHDGLKAVDAIHLATAIRSRAIGHVQRFDTWEGTLRHLGGQLHRIERLRTPGAGADLIIDVPSEETFLPLNGA